METWKAVPGFDKYEVSSFGRIKSFKWGAPKILKVRTHKSGYQVITLSVGAKKITRRLQHLVLEAFVSPRPEMQEAAHRNGDKTDNRLENLMWCSHVENESHKYRHGTSQRTGNLKVYTDDVVSDVINSVTRRGTSLRKAGKPHQMHHSTVARLVRSSTK